MPSSQEADAAVSGIAKAIADVCRRELTALLLSPDAAVGDRHLNALDAAVDLVEPLILASRDAAHRGYALRDFDTQAVSDLASARHALKVLWAVHGPQAADPTPAPL